MVFFTCLPNSQYLLLDHPLQVSGVFPRPPLSFWLHNPLSVSTLSSRYFFLFLSVSLPTALSPLGSLSVLPSDVLIALLSFSVSAVTGKPVRLWKGWWGVSAPLPWRIRITGAWRDTKSRTTHQRFLLSCCVVLSFFTRA